MFIGTAGATEGTFADLAVFLAKGYFGRHVSPDASLGQCVDFLNRNGVYFSFFELMDSGRIVTKEDVARVVGQVELLLSGEAEIAGGRIKKPVEAQTWVDYCLLNDVDFGLVWEKFGQFTAEGSLPEVREFLEK